MKGWAMYSKIQQLKENGLKKSQVTRYLKIDFKTTTKYWDMSPEEYSEYCKQIRRKKLDKYQDEILTLLYKHNDYTSAQILDILWERYPEDRDNIAASTLRAYVRELRQKHNIPVSDTIKGSKTAHQKRTETFQNPLHSDRIDE